MLVAGALALACAIAVAAGGTLRQQPGKAGCTSFTGSRGACRRGPALKFPESVVASRDGKSVYVAATSGGVAIFDRSRSGVLTQKRGRAGCVSQTIRSRRLCAPAKALRAPISLAISPDDRQVYVAALQDDAVAVFHRRADGALEQPAGRAGCASRAGQGCAKARALDAPTGVTVSPDGRNVYVAAFGVRGGVVVFDRDPRSGALRQKPGPRGCVADTLEARGCRQAAGLVIPKELTVSADGRNVYVATAVGVAVLDRAADGALSPKAGRSACFADDGTFDECASARALPGAQAVALSADDRSLYAASRDGVVVFDRDAAAGTLTQKPAGQGCITPTGAQSCARGVAVAFVWDVAVSPDDANVYVVAAQSSAVTTFERDPASGALRQSTGRARCVSQSGTDGRCVKGRGLANPHSLTVTADGISLYVAASTSSAVASFDRR